MKSCKDFPEVPCCSSCHDDYEEGYGDLLYICTHGQDEPIAHVCCTKVGTVKKSLWFEELEAASMQNELREKGEVQ